MTCLRELAFFGLRSATIGSLWYMTILDMRGRIVMQNYCGFTERTDGFFLKWSDRLKNSSDAEAPICPFFSFILCCIASADRQLAMNLSNSSRIKSQSKRSSISSEENLSIKRCHSSREAR